MKRFDDLRKQALSHPGNTFSAAQVLEVLGTLDGIEAVLDAERADGVRLEDAVLRASHEKELYLADCKRELARTKQATTAANKWRDKYKKTRRLVTEARSELAAPLLRRAEQAEANVKAWGQALEASRESVMRILRAEPSSAFNDGRLQGASEFFDTMHAVIRPPASSRVPESMPVSCPDTFFAGGLELRTPTYLEKTWDDATAYAATLELNGGGWRLPSLTELTWLYSSSILPFRPHGLYWTSTADGDTDGKLTRAWFVDLEYGTRMACRQSQELRVLCVRRQPKGA